MAVKTPNKTLDLLANPNQHAIEVYRANLATPLDHAAMRFWVQGELSRIQETSVSTDEAVKILASELLDFVQGGTQGPPGTDGQDGQDGDPGRGVAVFKTADGTPPPGALPGDIWIVEDCA